MFTAYCNVVTTCSSVAMLYSSVDPQLSVPYVRFHFQKRSDN